MDKKQITGYHLVMLTGQMENWAREYAPAFQSNLGLSAGASVPFASLYIALWSAGLNPRISSGFRDPAKQRALQARWDSGDRSGLRVRPATNSQHSKTDWLGRPASSAVDMPCSDDRRGAAIASSLGLGAGMSFSTPDPGHYYLLGAA